MTPDTHTTRRPAPRAISEVVNRVEGKPLQAVDLDLNPLEDIESLTDEELEKRIADLKKKLGF